MNTFINILILLLVICLVINNSRIQNKIGLIIMMVITFVTLECLYLYRYKPLEHFYLERDKLSLLHKQYIETPTPAIIKDMVELHISTLYPLATKIRELKYKFSTIEINDKNISKLIQEPYTYEELFISDIDDQPEIISNVY